MYYYGEYLRFYNGSALKELDEKIQSFGGIRYETKYKNSMEKFRKK